MKKLKAVLCLLVAAVLIVTQAMALPGYVRQGTQVTPQYQYELASRLAYYVQTLHIDSGPNDDPMLRAYQEIFETNKTLSPVALRAELIKWFREDPENADRFMDHMLWMYDHHTYILTMEEYAAGFPSSDDYKGIGLSYHIYGTSLWVDEVHEKSPAGEAEMQAGDRVVAVNGSDFRVMTPEEIGACMEEHRGQDVTMTVIRGEENEVLTFELAAGDVEIPNVSHEITDGVGVLRIERFSEEDFTEGLMAAREDFAAAGVKTVILDLRDNPGGSALQLIEALDALTPKAGELYFSERSRLSGEEHRSAGGGYETDAIYVLMTGNSASSAELMAGALRDMGLATLVGEKSYGKGRGQRTYSLDDYLVVCSVSEALLPVTGAYDGEGLEPDIAAAQEEVPYDYDALTALPKTAVSAGSDADAVTALEERLHLLGYLNASPDGVFDDVTLEALHELQEALGMAESDSASTALLGALADSAAHYADAFTWHDGIWEAVWDAIK